MKFLIIIPAFNEGKNLPLVAADLGDLVKDAIVVNDGSSDETGPVAAGCGFRVIEHPFNLGIGCTVQTGLKYALENGYDMAIQFDGDHQHRADQIKTLVVPVAEGAADLAIGSRVLSSSGSFTFLRRLGGRFFSLLLNLLTGVKVTDPTSGFRCYGSRTIALFAELYPEDYPEVESVLIGAKIGLRITEVPALMRRRTGGKSSINALEAVYYMIKVSLGLLIGSIRSAKQWRC